MIWGKLEMRTGLECSVVVLQHVPRMWSKLLVADLHRLLPRRSRLAACDLFLFLFAGFPSYIHAAFNYRLQTANFVIQENS